MDNLIKYLLDEIKTNPWSIKSWGRIIRILLVWLTITAFEVFIVWMWLLINSNKDISIYKDFSIALLPILGFLFLLSFFTFLIQKSAEWRREELVQKVRINNPELFDKIRDEIIGIERIEEKFHENPNQILYLIDNKNKVVELWTMWYGFELRFKKEFIWEEVIKKDEDFKDLSKLKEFWKEYDLSYPLIEGYFNEFYIAYPIKKDDVKNGTEKFTKWINYIKQVAKQIRK